MERDCASERAWERSLVGEKRSDWRHSRVAPLPDCVRSKHYSATVRVTVTPRPTLNPPATHLWAATHQRGHVTSQSNLNCNTANIRHQALVV
ncbi:hypothetical protein J6590_020460 [Homalodisca vitripennis]|nr:hypothetical protein J6590_020460 [Homalodisca vitripennis]